nr:MAG TPA: hypothetical protein [Caudoviricetes sp.]
MLGVIDVIGQRIGVSGDDGESFVFLSRILVQPTVVDAGHREDRFIFHIYIIRYLVCSFMPPFKIAGTGHYAPFLHDRFAERRFLENGIRTGIECHLSYFCRILFASYPERDESPVENLYFVRRSNDRISGESERIHMILFVKNALVNLDYIRLASVAGGNFDGFG